jgi:hypothetical protein
MIIDRHDGLPGPQRGAQQRVERAREGLREAQELTLRVRRTRLDGLSLARMKAIRDVARAALSWRTLGLCG